MPSVSRRRHREALRPLCLVAIIHPITIFSIVSETATWLVHRPEGALFSGDIFGQTST